jgi:hypothetical protein
MGLESYLFKIEFIEPIPEGKIISLFNAAGMTYLGDRKHGETITEYRSYYFEIRSEQGLTEAHCLLAPSETLVEEFSLRFSILSPKYVIDQTFKFLTGLSALKSFRIFDTEIGNHIYRKLRKEGKVDQSFEGLNYVEAKEIENLCHIPLDVRIFKQNEPSITKRQIILENEIGKTIEGGKNTTDYISKRGLFNRFIGWITNEL